LHDVFTCLRFIRCDDIALLTCSTNCRLPGGAKCSGIHEGTILLLAYYWLIMGSRLPEYSWESLYGWISGEAHATAK